VARAATLLAIVVVAGTAGYIALGFSALDALYQTVMTVTTVGFREVHELDARGTWLTIAIMVLGVGTALYTFGTVVEALVEGRLSASVRERRMKRDIGKMRDHVIVCGWGRVGKTVAEHARGMGDDVVVIDMDEERLSDAECPHIVGDATADDTLLAAGIARARAMVCALAEDADNLFVTLTARGLNGDLFIVSRARVGSSEAKLLQAGANRVVNPQRIGGARMASFTHQPHVAEFLDVVMHDGSLEFRLEEVVVPHVSPVAGKTLREAQLRDRTGALVLAMRVAGEFTTNPEPEAVIEADSVLIAIGTAEQLDALGRLVRDVDREGSASVE
jgi:voltage-gated potassium channel